MQQFSDDPEMLMDEDRQRQNEMSLMVADKLDKLQKQYMNNTTTNAMGGGKVLNHTSMGFMPVGQQVIKKNGSLNASKMDLDPVKLQRWVKD